jgi:polysaccharide biosynthesis protein PslJ
VATVELAAPAPPLRVDHRARRRRVLPTWWPLAAMIGGYPLWWALGIANVTWAIFAVPLIGQLLQHRRLRAPRGFGLWLLFLAWMLLSAAMLEQFSHYVAFGWRASLWISAVVVLVYVVNTPRSRLPDRTLYGIVLVLWGAAVIGGILGLVLGDVRLWTPAQLIVPRSLADVDFIENTIAPRFAQVQDFLGYPLPRPAAPFAFTNEWGANLALLWPVVVAAWPHLRARGRRAVATLAVISFVPMVVSVNRGLWVTLAATVVYASVRLAQRRDPRAARRLVVIGAVVLGVLVLTPLASIVSGRLEDDHSNNARLTLYSQVQEQVQESPLLGFGSPRSNEDNPNYPPVGTHGTFWLVLFSHGVPGAIFFVGGLVSLAARTSRPKDRRMLWLHAVVVAALVEIPFYDLLPVPIFTMMVAAALVLRAEQEAAVPV